MGTSHMAQHSIFEHRIYVKIPSGVRKKGRPSHKLVGEVVYIREGVTYIEGIFRGVYDELNRVLIYYNPGGILGKTYIGVVSDYEMYFDSVISMLQTHKDVLEENVLPAGMRIPVLTGNEMDVRMLQIPKKMGEITAQELYYILRRR